MLYQSLYVPQGHAAFDRSVLTSPEIANYVKDWGRPDDFGFVAVDENNRGVGATWLRLFRDEAKGFGYVDDQTPELGLAVLPEYRGQGIGTMLLNYLIESAASFFQAICLSVAAENPASRLYQRLGFEIVDKRGDALTMRRELRRQRRPGHITSACS